MGTPRRPIPADFAEHMLREPGEQLQARYKCAARTMLSWISEMPAELRHQRRVNMHERRCRLATERYLREGKCMNPAKHPLMLEAASRYGDPQAAERRTAKQGSDDLLRRYSEAAARNGLGWHVLRVPGL